MYGDCVPIPEGKNIPFNDQAVELYIAEQLISLFVSQVLNISSLTIGTISITSCSCSRRRATTITCSSLTRQRNA
jgi:hypothetical protein